MAIDNIKPNFLQATSHYKSLQFKGTQPISYQGVPNTTPQVQPAFRPSVEDMEKAQAFIDGNYKIGGENPAAAVKPQRPDAKGEAFRGFTVPENNGTGELIPNVDDREDSLGAFKAYMA